MDANTSKAAAMSADADPATPGPGTGRRGSSLNMRGAQLVLVCAGLLSAAVGLLGVGLERSATQGLGLVVVGLGAAAVGALLPRLASAEVGPTGLKVSMREDARAAEENGVLNDVLVAADGSSPVRGLPNGNDSRTEDGPASRGMASRVLLTSRAHSALERLTPMRRSSLLKALDEVALDSEVLLTDEFRADVPSGFMVARLGDLLLLYRTGEYPAKDGVPASRVLLAGIHLVPSTSAG